MIGKVISSKTMCGGKMEKFGLRDRRKDGSASHRASAGYLRCYGIIRTLSRVAALQRMAERLLP